MRGYVEHVEQVGHVGYMDTLGTAFSRLQNYPAHYVPLLKQANFKNENSTSKNCVYSSRLFWLKNNIFEFLNAQTILLR